MLKLGGTVVVELNVAEVHISMLFCFPSCT